MHVLLHHHIASTCVNLRIDEKLDKGRMNPWRAVGRKHVRRVQGIGGARHVRDAPSCLGDKERACCEVPWAQGQLQGVGRVLKSSRLGLRFNKIGAPLTTFHMSKLSCAPNTP